jgi:aspartyl-tRNA(Asn)/glutamyl-tRNA(Gln) amidotransferase subunit C
LGLGFDLTFELCHLTFQQMTKRLRGVGDEFMKMDIEKVAKLARLELSEKEKNTLGNQLEQILTYMEQLNRIDTTGVEPTSHAIPIQNAFREDDTRPSFSREDVLGIAPEEEDGHFKVPRIIE